MLNVSTDVHIYEASQCSLLVSDASGLQSLAVYGYRMKVVGCVRTGNWRATGVTVSQMLAHSNLSLQNDVSYVAFINIVFFLSCYICIVLCAQLRSQI